MNRFRRTAVAALLVAAGAAAPHQSASPVLDVMKAELDRSLTALRAQPTPPYFLSYEVTEVQTAAVGGSFGAITESASGRRRHLDVELRVGDYAFDNTHTVTREYPDFGDMELRAGADMPLDDDPTAIRGALWYHTDRSYRRAVERLTAARTNAEIAVRPEDQSPDFSREPPARHHEPPLRLTIDRAAWEDRIRRYTAPFARVADIYQAHASFHAAVETRWYVNSDGSEIQTAQAIYRLYINAYSKADDGMELPRHESFLAFTPEGLPADSTVLRAVDRMIADLQALRVAPVIEPYAGPAILSGRASAVFFHEVFGHRIEGHRQKREDEGQTFKQKVNEAVLPADFAVRFDPTVSRLSGTDLAGFYRYDDEGVLARPVAVVERGVLRTFLMSRSPIQGFANSNGHGRRQAGFPPVARQSNLIVQTARPRSRADLKRMLLDAIRRERKPFGLFFDDIEGGFTITTRGIPNAFNVMPVMVYRVFPDGREELVRGVDLIGTPLATFSRITAADDQVEVFNGMCGAESGLVPVSAVSPGVFLSQIEVQKKSKSQERPPLLPPPPAEPGATPALRRAMDDELARSMAELRLDTLPRPYFIAYRVQETNFNATAASFGSLLHTTAGRRRLLTVEVRVGDYAFDNTNFFGMRTGPAGMMGGVGFAVLPLDDNYREIRRDLWLATDNAYKAAVEQFAQKQAGFQGRGRDNYVPDFTHEPVTTTVDTAPAVPADFARMEALVRELAAGFRNRPALHRSRVDAAVANSRTWYVNSEGTSYTVAAPFASVRITASGQATDGMPLGDGVVVFAPSFAELPPAPALGDSIRRMVDRLTALRLVPRAEVYRGPVLFEGAAAGELVNQLFAPFLAAARAPQADNAMAARMGAMENPFHDLIGGRVLPAFLNVTDNPGLRTHDGHYLGASRVDDDGVPTRETRLVERGILKTLLTTRVPVEDLRRSTGSRRGAGAAVANLIFTVDGGSTTADLRARLLRLAAERGNAYAVVVRRIANPSLAAELDPMSMMGAFGGQGGGDQTLVVSEAIRLYPDGREEPIRNAGLSGITATTFRDIVAVSRGRAVFTAPSGGRRGRFGGAGGSSYAPSYVVPWLLFEEATLRRRGGEPPPLPAVSPPWGTP